MQIITGGESDRGAQFGDGLFETWLSRGGKLLLEDFHWQRLTSGCARLGLEPDLPRVKQAVTAAAKESRDPWSIVKLRLFRVSDRRGYAVTGGDCDATISVYSTGDPREGAWQSGVRVMDAQLVLARQPALAGIKHLSRLEQVLAATEALDRGVDEVLLYDDRGELIEGSRSNVLLRHGDTWQTPALEFAGVAGVVRRWLLEQASPQVTVGTVSRDSVGACDEMLLCNSVLGIVPVIGLNGRRLSVGAGTRQWQQQLETEFLA